MHSLPASQAYCTSVVNMHSNIPSRDFTTRNETKEELKQDVGTTQPTKRSASNSSRAKAANDKAPTIVSSIITVKISPSDSLEVHTMAWLQPDGADKVLHADSGKAALPDGNVSPWGPSHAEDLEASALMKPPLRTESHARRSEFKSPSEEAPTKNDLKTMCSNGPIVQCNDLQLSKSPGSATAPQDQGRDSGGETRHPSYRVDGGLEVGMRNDSLSPEEKGLMTGNHDHSVQVKPIVPQGDSLVQTNLLQPESPLGDPDKGVHVARTVGCTIAPTKIADEGEAASAQVVKRGPQVRMEEVPDHEDDTSFQLSQKANRNSSIAPEVTQSMVAEPSNAGAKTEKVPHKWLKPFGAEWTL